MSALRFLGPLQLESGGTTTTSFRSNRAVALLAYLASQPGPVPRGQLIELIWPDRPAGQGQANLRWALNYLGSLLPGSWESSRQTIRFLPGAVEIDLERLRAALAAGAPAELETAMAGAAGEFMHGFYLDASPEFEIWLLGQRESWRRQQVQALQMLLAYQGGRGAYAAALQWATRLLALEPWREEVHRQVMLLLARTGQRSAALVQYDQVRRVLDEELGVEPGAETVALYERIKAAGSVFRHALPPQPTPFIGREEELARIRTLLADPGCRLITIAGIGGLGKSRLAIRAAELAAGAQVQMFLHGVVFVPLENVGDADFFFAALARRLDLDLRGRGTPEQVTLSFLRDKEMLLLLDGYEHLLPATGPLTAILAAAPDVKLLVTSRERLDLQQEWLFPAGGLAYPDGDPAGLAPEQLSGFDAVRLFAATARRVQPRFCLEDNVTHVLQILRLVGGVPLAIELAAGQLTLLSVAEIAAELERSLGVLATTHRDMPERHRSVRAAIEGSWLTLAPEARQVMARLTVFRGGITRHAAGVVAGASPAILAALVDKSLLQLAPDGRYDTLELLCQYGEERLVEMGEESAAQERHLRYFLALAEEAEEHVAWPDQAQWLDRLQREQYNLAAALRRAWADGQVETAARLTGALGRFWSIRGYVGEGRYWLDKALARREQISAPLLAQVLYAAGELAFEQGEHAQARGCYEQSLALWRTAGDASKTARLLTRLGHVVQQQQDFAAAQPLYEESLDLYRGLDDKRGVALALNRLGHLAQMQGQLEPAAAYLEESLALRRALDDRRGVAATLNGLAEIARFRGDYARAVPLYTESLALCRELGDKRCLAGLSHNFGYVALYQGDLERAAALFRESLVLFQELAHREGQALSLAGLAAVWSAQGQVERATLLVGATEALMAAAGTPLIPADRQAWDETISRLRAQLGEEAFAAAAARGRRLSAAEVAALVG